MSTQARLNKTTVALLKIAHSVEFIRKRYEHGGQKVIARIYITQDAVPITAVCGDDRAWDAHDTLKAKRSIRRHNATCLILDRRDQVIG